MGCVGDKNGTHRDQKWGACRPKMEHVEAVMAVMGGGNSRSLEQLIGGISGGRSNCQ